MLCKVDLAANVGQGSFSNDGNATPYGNSNYDYDTYYSMIITSKDKWMAKKKGLGFVLWRMASIRVVVVVG